MAFWFQRAHAAAVLGMLVMAPSAMAQNQGWVDPPRSPAAKPETPPPAAPAPEATRPPPSPAVAGKAAPSAESDASQPAGKRLARAKPKPVVETRRAEDKRQVEEKRTVDIARPAASRRAVAADQPRQERVIREAGSEPLELMTLRTIEFPDGRRVQVLIRPDPETTTGLLRR